jgi:hypothetical protein
LQGVQQVAAGPLAAPAGLGADPAVLMHVDVPLTLVAAALQMATQAPSSGLVTLASYWAWRLMTLAVAVQISVQSRHSRTQLTMSAA